MTVHQRLPIVGATPAPEAPEPVAADSFAGNAAIVTLGCSKNLVDSEVMLGALVERGFQATADPEQAEIVVVNTCAFLESAVDEGIDRILELSELKKQGRCRALIVAGCMVERYREQLAEELPEVDQFISTDELLDVGKLSEGSSRAFEQARRPYFIYDETSPRIRSTQSSWTYVKIAEGCDRPCSFCIIPKIRGSFRSRSIESIRAEVSQLVGQGVRECNLVAQDLTAYGTDFSENKGRRSALPDLLLELNSLATDDAHFWIRLFYAYPVHTDARLIELIQSLPTVCPYLDIPLQHISKPVLKNMRRPLGEKGTRALVEMIAGRAPEIALRTTFIVGFPGETEDDVRELERFVRQGYFTHVGVFTYSDEQEASAASLTGKIDDAVKEERRARIMEAQQAVVAERLATKIGTREHVLLLEPHEETDLLYTARANWQGPEADGLTLVNDREDESVELADLSGAFVEVEYTDVAGYDLLAKLVSTPHNN